MLLDALGSGALTLAEAGSRERPGTFDVPVELLPMSSDLPGIFLAGLLTFLSPCVLPLLPLYLSFLAGVSISELRESGQGARRPWVVALAFSFGLAVVFVALGMAATTVGAALDEHRVRAAPLRRPRALPARPQAARADPVPWLDRESRPWLNRVQRGGNVVGAFLFGAAFALGWTPCIGPVLGAVLTYTSASTSDPALGALYLGTYAAGITTPLLAVAVAAPCAPVDGREPAVICGRFSSPRARCSPRWAYCCSPIRSRCAANCASAEQRRCSRRRAGGRSAEARAGRSTSIASIDGREAPAGAECASEASGEATCAFPESVGSDWLATESAGLVESSRPTMVEFVSPSCPVCERMVPVVAIAEQACSHAGVDVLRIDVAPPKGGSSPLITAFAAYRPSSSSTATAPKCLAGSVSSRWSRSSTDSKRSPTSAARSCPRPLPSFFHPHRDSPSPPVQP